MKKYYVVIIMIIFVSPLLSNNALYFDGIDDKIIVAENASEFPDLFTDLDNKNFSIAFWLYPQSNSTLCKRILDITHNSNEYLVLTVYQNKLCMIFKSPEAGLCEIASNQAINYDEWYYVRIIWRSGTGHEISLWIDNELQSGTHAGFSRGAENCMYLGSKTNSSSYFYGKIDEFTIWNSASVDWQLKDAFPDQLTGSESNLYMYYDMEDFYQGSSMEDKSANNFHGVCTGTSLVEMEAWDGGFKCLFLDGVNDHVAVLDCSDLNSTDYTYSLWFNTDDLSSDQYLLSKGNDGYYLKIGSDEQLEFNGYSTSEASLETDQWYNVAVSKDQNEHKLYLDGREMELTGTSNVSSNSDPLYIGKRSSYLFSGKIDDIQLYNTALTQQEIADRIYSNYQDHANLTGWFECSRFEGNIVYDRKDNLQASFMGLEEGVTTSISNNWIKDEAQTWSEDQFNGYYTTILHTDFFQDRLIEITANGIQLTVSEDWSPMLSGEVDYEFCIADAQRADSDLIYPDDLPTGYESSGFTIWQNHRGAYSCGLLIESTGISGSDWLQGGCNGEEGTTSEDIDTGTIDNRLSRVWFMDSEGSLTGLSLEFDIEQICGAGISLGNANDYRLLYRNGSRDMFSAVTENITIEKSGDTVLSITGSGLDSPEGFYTIGVTNDAPLPVTLTSFLGNWTGNACCLNWQTCSEVNNCGWNIYRQISETEQLKVNPLLIEGAGTTSESNSYSFIDEYGSYEQETVTYWLESVSLLGAAESYGPITITIPPPEQESPPVPDKYFLECFPNPFNPRLQVNFCVEYAGSYCLKIYNLKGQLITSLLKDESLQANLNYSLLWDDADRGSSIYLIHLSGQGVNWYRKVVCLK